MKYEKEWSYHLTWCEDDKYKGKVVHSFDEMVSLMKSLKDRDIVFECDCYYI